ncbi:MAG TPA: hypothetical protein VL463_13025 [Kofleriaceae bacterium]|nr:hypothetical protein [Kofleriaceae bacterium]
MRRFAVVVSFAMACGHPRAVDVRALVAAHGLDGAADELRFRVASDPHDRDALASLGEIEARRGRPGAALEALDRAAALGGAPWDPLDHDARAKLAQLYLARAEERADRGAPSALEDLDRARALGASIPRDLARDATIARALAELRHADPKTRARGLGRLRSLDPRDPRFSPGTAEHGVWLWEHGAKRAAVLALDAWAASGAHDPRAAQALVEARAWWGEAVDARAAAAATDLCAIATAPGDRCALDDPATVTIVWRRAEAHAWRSNDPAWLVLAARAWLRGDTTSYLAAVDAHFDPHSDVAWARPTVLRMTGASPADRDAALDAALADPKSPRLVLAVEAAYLGRSPDRIETIVRADHDPLGDELLARVAEPAPPIVPDLAHAAALHAARANPGLADELATIAAAYLREPALADRLAADWIARDVDVSARAPLAAELFAALGDPARARALWQRAADASPGEVQLVRGLALAAAGTDDPDAAMILVTGAAAASGDAAPVLTDVARALAAHGRYDHALELLKLALQLVPDDDRAPLYDLAIAWSQAEGKDTTALAAARSADPPAPAPAKLPDDPDELARLARLSPRDLAVHEKLMRLPAADPRRARARADLAAIAADPRVSDDDASAAWSAFSR